MSFFNTTHRHNV